MFPPAPPTPKTFIFADCFLRSSSSSLSISLNSSEGEYSKDYEELDVSFSTEDVKMSINKFLEMLEGLKDSDVLNAMLLKSEDGKW